MRDAGGLLLRAMLREAGGEGEARCLTIRSIAWVSATFTGARHELTLLLRGKDAEARATTIGAEIASMEFALPGHLVADAAFVGRRVTAEGVEIDLEALTVEEA